MARTKSFDEAEVLHNILMLFWDKGYYQTSLDDILKISGISRQSMYDTYGDKKSLFLKTLALYREESKRLIEGRLNEMLQKGESSLDVLRNMVFYNDGRGCLAINSMVEFKASDDSVCKEVDSLLLFSKEMIGNVVTVGQANGEITTGLPSEHITEVLMNARTGFQVAQNYQIAQEELNNIADWTLELIRTK